MSEELLQKINDIKKSTKLNEKKEEIKALSTRLEDSAIWADHQKASLISKNLADLKNMVEKVEELDLLYEMGDFAELAKKVAEMEVLTVLSAPYDKDGCYITISAGQGGTEAMDWASMLSRMYSRFFVKKGWDFVVIDENQGEEAGIKSIIYKVDGLYSYGFLKNESGAHRLVRQSPFNADNLRQTSFAQVEVIPQISNEKNLDILETDLQIDFFRASGHGGQNVNKVSTAVRIKHIPTGIVVSSQTERYQNKNRELALNLLKSKLGDLMEKEKVDEVSKIKGDFKPASWGYQIRNYVLHPYKLVKDVRTQVESTRPDLVLDGDIDEFVNRGIYLPTT